MLIFNNDQLLLDPGLEVTDFSYVCMIVELNTRVATYPRLLLSSYSVNMIRYNTNLSMVASGDL